MSRPAPAPDDRPSGQRATSFGAVAEEYDHFRLSPSPEILSWALRPNDLQLADIGAGTGQLTRILLDRGATVSAVEPDAGMRAVLGRSAPQAITLAGTAERLPLADRSQDAVLSHAAWHWFHPLIAVTEAARVLRGGGRLCVLRTAIDPGVEWLEEFWDQLEPDPEARRPGGRLPPGQRLSDRLTQWRQARQFADRQGAPFRPRQGPHAVRHRRGFTRPQLLGLAATYSGLLARSPADRGAALAELEKWLSDEPRLGPAEGVEVPLITTCWRAERR